MSTVAGRATGCGTSTSTAPTRSAVFDATEELAEARPRARRAVDPAPAHRALRRPRRQRRRGGVPRPGRHAGRPRRRPGRRGRGRAGRRRAGDAGRARAAGYLAARRRRASAGGRPDLAAAGCVSADEVMAPLAPRHPAAPWPTRPRPSSSARPEDEGTAHARRVDQPGARRAARAPTTACWCSVRTSASRAACTA